jgi:hypothetical protein
MGDRLDSYRQGRDARRAGTSSDAYPDEGREEWEAGWWDEEAFATQREAMAVEHAKAEEYRRATLDVLGSVPDFAEVQSTAAALRVLYAPLLERLREAHAKANRLHGLAAG